MRHVIGDRKRNLVMGRLRENLLETFEKIWTIRNLIKL
jgi:hypothetical protein